MSRPRDDDGTGMERWFQRLHARFITTQPKRSPLSSVSQKGRIRTGKDRDSSHPRPNTTLDADLVSVSVRSRCEQAGSREKWKWFRRYRIFLLRIRTEIDLLSERILCCYSNSERNRQRYVRERRRSARPPFLVILDGTSALVMPDGTTRIRPLNEFLLFSSNDPRKPPIRPKYKGSAVIRDIPVNQWETCIVNKATRLTQKRIWSFAASTAVVPIGPVGNMAVPVQAIINASISFENGTQAVEFDEVFNVHAYRPGIIESTDQLAPPKGVFCKYNGSQSLATLSEIGIEWPDRFSVRVEASSSRSAQWQRFHLRYDRGGQRRGRRIRYDYLPAGSEDYRSVIHDYGENLTYSIDLRTGACGIGRLVPMPDVNPILNPIEFFIKYERDIISNNRGRVWEFNGYRGKHYFSILTHEDYFLFV